MIGRQFFVTLYSRLPVNSRPVLSLARPNCFNRLCKVSAGPSRPFASNQSELAELEGDIRKENLRLSYDFGHYSFAQSGIVESAGCEPSLRLFFGLEETKEIPNRELSMEEWTQFCDKKFVSERKFRTVFVTATLEYFRQKDLNLLGRSFVAFLINQKLFVSAVQVGAAIRFYAKFPQFFTEKDFLQLVAVLDKSSKPSVSFYLSQKLAALSFTSRLKECLSTLEQLKAIESLSAPQYSCAVRAAAHNNNMESAIELLKEMGDNNFRLAEDTVLEVISCWSRLSANPSMMSQADFLLEALLVCLGRNQQHLNDAIASIMMSHFDNQGYKVTRNTINKGICPECKDKLESMDMSEAEMNQLKKKLLDTTFLNSLYATTTPQEFDNFMFYLRRQKPYEIVVDGLNVMYRRSQLPDWRDALKNNMTMLLKTVETLKKRFQRILVIGKLHMYQQKEVVKQIKEIADIYLVENDSKDDPFILMAAINHPQTFFLSGDFFADHRHKLPVAERILFQKWDRMRHIYFVEGFNSIPGKRKVQLLFPQQWDIRPQKSLVSGGWHIPYVSGKPITPSTITNSWLCAYRSADRLSSKRDEKGNEVVRKKNAGLTS